MIEFLSSWAEQIVLSVIIVTIIELILPNNKNRKYIQMVIGIYILFNIISPVIENKQVFSFEEYENNSVYISSSGNVIDQTSMDKRIEKIYIEELEKNIIKKFEENGYEVIKCEVDGVLNSNDKNAGIHLITVKLKKNDKESGILVEEIKEEISEEYEIDKSKIVIKN